MFELKIRKATSGDVNAIAELYLEVGDEVVSREPSLRHLPARAGVVRRYASRVTDPNRVVIVATADNSVIGFVDAALRHQEDPTMYSLPGLSVYVEELNIAPAMRRRGAASRLMQTVEAWAKDAGARAIMLDTHVTNTDARSLYAALDYREIGVLLLKEL